MRHEVDRGVPVPMRDGRVLLADVYRPSRPGRYPTLLERTPYGPHSSEAALHAGEFYSSHGYSVVLQNVAGRFGSEGTFRPFEHDGTDGVDTLRWISRQAWSTGRIASIGGSYSGFTQHSLSGGFNRGLRCQHQRQTPTDVVGHVTYRGGAFELAFCMSWVLENEVIHNQSADAAEALASLDAWLLQLPLTPFAPLAGTDSSYDQWRKTRPEDPYWTNQTRLPDFREASTPVFHLGGWYDPFLEGTLQAYEALASRSDHGGDPIEQRLLVGPWAHGSDQMAVPRLGDATFGQDSTRDPLEMRLPWLDAWMKGQTAALAEIPQVSVFTMGIDQWLAYDAWPPPRSRSEEFFLSPDQSGSASSLNDGSLSPRTSQGGDQTTSYTYDPSEPVETLGGAIVHHFAQGPIDQRNVESRCLTFSTQPISPPLHVAGPVTCRLFVHSTGADTDWVARLTDVYPDGSSLLITEGILRSRFREGLDRPHLMRDDVYQVLISLTPTAMVFGEGHRIRLTITSSCFPRWNRNLNTGDSNALESTGVVVRNTLFHDPARPSSLMLTVA